MQVKEVLDAVLKELGPSAVGVSYQLCPLPDGRQFLFNGFSSVALPPTPMGWHLHLTAAGQSFVSNGTESVYCEQVFAQVGDAHPRKQMCLLSVSAFQEWSRWIRHIFGVFLCL